MSLQALKNSPMMAHLLDALDSGKDIGHYGRLTFVMVARHFLDEQAVVDWLQKDPDFSEDEAKGLYQQVSEKAYSPPKRNSILDWQAQQDFAICPSPDDPDACNVYQDLQFPSDVYDHISEYYEEKAT